MSILVEKDGKNLLICKGAVHTVLDVCKTAETGEGTIISLIDAKDEINAEYTRLSNEGFRLIGVSYREDIDYSENLEKEAEVDLTFLGFLIFHDPLRTDMPKLSRISAISVSS